MNIQELEQTAALRILLHLFEKGKASRTNLRNGVAASTAAIYNALTKLKNLELIREEKEERFPFTVEVSLTDKGRKIAEKIFKIKQILTEQT